MTMNLIVRERLRSGGADRFVDLLLDDLLDRPVSELVDAAWLAGRLVEIARTSATDARIEDALRRQIQALRKQIPSGPTRLPPNVEPPLRDLLGRPFVPDQVLVGRILDHEAARQMLRSMFQDLLVAFARKVRPALPTQKPSLPFARLQKLGEEMLGAVGQEFEKHLEDRAREFMDTAMQRLIAKMAEHLCSPQHSNEYAAWRLHALDVLLATDRQRIVAEVDKLDPEAMVATGSAIARAIVNRPEFVGEVEGFLTSLLERAENRSLRALGVDEASVALLRDLLRQRARAVIETDAFAQWWDEMNEGQP